MITFLTLIAQKSAQRQPHASRAAALVDDDASNTSSTSASKPVAKAASDASSTNVSSTATALSKAAGKHARTYNQAKTTKPYSPLASMVKEVGAASTANAKPRGYSSLNRNVALNGIKTPDMDVDADLDFDQDQAQDQYRDRDRDRDRNLDLGSGSSSSSADSDDSIKTDTTSGTVATISDSVLSYNEVLGTDLKNAQSPLFAHSLTDASIYVNENEQVSPFSSVVHENAIPRSSCHFSQETADGFAIPIAENEIGGSTMLNEALERELSTDPELERVALAQRLAPHRRHDNNGSRDSSSALGEQSQANGRDHDQETIAAVTAVEPAQRPHPHTYAKNSSTQLPLQHELPPQKQQGGNNFAQASSTTVATAPISDISAITDPEGNVEAEGKSASQSASQSASKGLSQSDVAEATGTTATGTTANSESADKQSNGVADIGDSKDSSAALLETQLGIKLSRGAQLNQLTPQQIEALSSSFAGPSTQQNALQAKHKKGAVTTLPGFFAYDHTTLTVYLDEQAAFMLGIDWHPEGIKQVDFLNYLRGIDRDLLMSFNQQRMGETDSMFFIAQIIRGPMAGNKYHLNIGALARNEDGNLIIGSGFFSYNRTDTSKVTIHELGKDGSWDWDGTNGTTNFSESYKIMLGYAPDDPEFPKSFEEWGKVLVHPDDIEDTVNKQRMILESPQYGDAFECCIRLKHKDGHYIWTLGRGMVLGRDQNGRALRLSGTNTDIEFVRYNYDVTRMLSWTDHLTGLKNRNFFDTNRKNYLEEENAPLGCLFADLTGLKMINDYLGHEAGDTLLRQAAKALHAAYNLPCDIIRYGGDEFVMMIPHCKDLQLDMLAKNVEAMCHGVSSEKGSIPLIIGCGVASLAEAHGDLNEMIFLADQRAQETKKNRHAENYRILHSYIEERLGTNINYKDSRNVMHWGHDK